MLLISPVSVKHCGGLTPQPLLMSGGEKVGRRRVFSTPSYPPFIGWAGVSYFVTLHSSAFQTWCVA